MDVMGLSFYFNPCNPKSPEDPKKSLDNGKLVENEFEEIKTINSFESIHKQFNETSKVQTPKSYSELKYKVPKYKIQKYKISEYKQPKYMVQEYSDDISPIKNEKKLQNISDKKQKLHFKLTLNQENSYFYATSLINATEYGIITCIITLTYM